MLKCPPHHQKSKCFPQLTILSLSRMTEEKAKIRTGSDRRRCSSHHHSLCLYVSYWTTNIYLTNPGKTMKARISYYIGDQILNRKGRAPDYRFHPISLFSDINYKFPGGNGVVIERSFYRAEVGESITPEMSGRKLVESCAIAAGDIPSGSKSQVFELSNLSHILAKVETAKLPLQFKVYLSTSKELQPVQEGLYFWPKMIQFAPDCHLQNVKVCRWQQGKIILQTTRHIRDGQPLYLWFEESILVDNLDVPPYLSPSNIRGGKSYVCDKCGNEFEAPNPLKVHIALDCGRFSRNVLWSRLAAQKPFPQTLSLLVGSSSPFHTITRPTCFVPSQLLRQIDIPSVPRPFITLPQLTSASSTAQIQVPVTTAHQLSVVQKTHSEHQAHLEAIMSNMGKSKNGHVCLYCGKLYSRKYGLKIHIRTHTGFKPLHCRICKRPFGDPSNLNKHVRLHSDGNTPYKCDICAKVLVRKRDLDRHTRSRHPNHASQRRGAVSSSTITSSVASD